MRFSFLLLIGLATAAQAQTYDVFDPKGSHGTIAVETNSSGVTAGYYKDVNDVVHGFIRNAKGKFTIFDVPGAGTGTGQGTYVAAISGNGRIAGWFSDSASKQHGYVRDKTGAFSTFDVPGFEGTTHVIDVDDKGRVVGYYAKDFTGNPHCFLRQADGTIQLTDPRDAQDCKPAGINNNGLSVGYYEDADYNGHCFQRTANGKLTTFDVGRLGGFVNGINDDGVMVGTAFQTGNRFKGFIRTADGHMTYFDAQGIDTFPTGINAGGAASGYIYDKNIGERGWIRTPDGTVTLFDAPGAVIITMALAINDDDQITGYFTGADGASHGYLRK